MHTVFFFSKVAKQKLLNTLKLPIKKKIQLFHVLKEFCNDLFNCSLNKCKRFILLKMMSEGFIFITNLSKMFNSHQLIPRHDNHCHRQQSGHKRGSGVIYSLICSAYCIIHTSWSYQWWRAHCSGLPDK